MEKNIYYVGFNANNSILNNILFEGSITLYPTCEKGNIYFSDTVLEDTTSINFLSAYKLYIEKTVQTIIEQKGSCSLMCFNEKILKLCSDLKNIKIIKNNSKELIDFLNDKYKIREYLKDDVPILKYKNEYGNKLNFTTLKEEFSTEQLVIQGIKGAGGENTYFITSEEDLLKIQNKNTKYCISEYHKHLPLNTTLIIGNQEILQFPLSAQLISNKTGTFKYVGGDFVYPSERLGRDLQHQITIYNDKIAKKIKDLGYRGILGIDYILTEEGKIIFMELNPRFQSSTFILNQYLQENYQLDIATLHYMAIEGVKLPKIKIKNDEIQKSFLNCNVENDFSTFENYHLLTKGFFKENITSCYRKIYNYSLVEDNLFQHIKLKSIKEEKNNAYRKSLRD